MTIMLSGYSGAEFDVNGVRVFRCRDETHPMGLCRCCGERALRGERMVLESKFHPLCRPCNDIEDEARLSGDSPLFAMNRRNDK